MLDNSIGIRKSASSTPRPSGPSKRATRIALHIPIIIIMVLLAVVVMICPPKDFDDNITLTILFTVSM
jgi:hypothetical protein